MNHSPEPDSEESRIYYYVRSDVIADRETISSWAAVSTWELVSRACTTEFWSDYDLEVQPKICCKAKSPSQLGRIMADAGNAGIPVGSASDAMGELVIVAVGPTKRPLLPQALRRAQLLTHLNGLVPHRSAGANDEPPAAPVALFLVRSDIVIPVGKLVAQIGHASISALRPHRGQEIQVPADIRPVVQEVSSLERVSEIVLDADNSGLHTEVITDIGRTVFPVPTQTVAVIGPCLMRELPASARQAMAEESGTED